MRARRKRRRRPWRCRLRLPATASSVMLLRRRGHRLAHKALANLLLPLISLNSAAQTKKTPQNHQKRRSEQQQHSSYRTAAATSPFDADCALIETKPPLEEKQQQHVNPSTTSNSNSCLSRRDKAVGWPTQVAAFVSSSICKTNIRQKQRRRIKSSSSSASGSRGLAAAAPAAEISTTEQEQRRRQTKQTQEAGSFLVLVSSRGYAECGRFHEQTTISRPKRREQARQGKLNVGTYCGSDGSGGGGSRFRPVMNLLLSLLLGLSMLFLFSLLLLFLLLLMLSAAASTSSAASAASWWCPSSPSSFILPPSMPLASTPPQPSAHLFVYSGAGGADSEHQQVKQVNQVKQVVDQVEQVSGYLLPLAPLPAAAADVTNSASAATTSTPAKLTSDSQQQQQQQQHARYTKLPQLQAKLGLHYYNQSRRRRTTASDGDEQASRLLLLNKRSETEAEQEAIAGSRTQSARSKRDKLTQIEDDAQVQVNVKAQVKVQVDDNHVVRERQPKQEQQQQQQDDEVLVVETKQGALFRGRRLMRSTAASGGAGSRDLYEKNQVIGFLGIRYASAPIKRLRFMPPRPFHYASNQIHNMQQFGPICRQRFPFPAEIAAAAGAAHAANETTRAAANEQQQQGPTLGGGSGGNRRSAKKKKKQQLELQLSLMRRLMGGERFARSSALIRRLTRWQQSEDCLNLNVYAPLTALRKVSSAAASSSARSATINGADEERNSSTTHKSSNVTHSQKQQQHQASQLLLPVLLLIHPAQDFDFGSGNLLDPAQFVRQTGIIVVTLNYRLNLLGFPPKMDSAALNSYSSPSTSSSTSAAASSTRSSSSTSSSGGARATANLGLMDQVAALHWIRENIAAFGGSSERISVMGSKEGAILANLLMLSPLAKGLFARAILEDGSALTPLVANHLPSPPPPTFTSTSTSTFSGGAGQAAHQHHHLSRVAAGSAGQRHLRLLAALLECPVMMQQQQQQDSMNASSHAARMTLQGAGVGARSQEFFATSTRTNAGALYECLRQAPVDQLMQHIPMDLVELATTSSSTQPTASGTTSTHNNNGSNYPAAYFYHHQVAPVVAVTDARLLEKLHHWRRTMSGLVRDDGSTNNSLLEQQQQAMNNPSEQVNLSELRALLADLARDASIQPDDELKASAGNETLPMDQFSVSAIWGPTRSSVGPLFGPVLDQGSIIAQASSSPTGSSFNSADSSASLESVGDDLLASMLRSPQSSSSFAQRDLLIGLSGEPEFVFHPTTSSRQSHLSSSSSSSNLHQIVSTQRQRNSTSVKSATTTRFDYLIMGAHINEQQETRGITAERAIELLNNFVRTTYRYHQQEIANSIINHYLTSSSGSGSGIGSSSSSHTVGMVQDNSGMPSSPLGMEQDLAAADPGKRERLQLLDSMRKLFQDALITVPLLKTALIHALKQLEPLAESFVAQEFEKWRQQQQQLTHQLETSYYSASNHNASQLEHQQKQLLLDSFIAFVERTQNPRSILASNYNTDTRTNYYNPPPTKHRPKQQRSTYLYQVDNQLVLDQVSEALEQLKAVTTSQHSSNSSSSSDSNGEGDGNSHQLSTSFGWRSLRQSLAGLLIKLQDSHYHARHSLNFHCLFDNENDADDDVDDGIVDTEEEFSASANWEEDDTSSSQMTTEQEQDLKEDLVRKFHEWVCFSRFAPTLANFVATGNVNSPQVTSPPSDDQLSTKTNDHNEQQAEAEVQADTSQEQEVELFFDRVANYEEKCNLATKSNNHQYVDPKSPHLNGMRSGEADAGATYGTKNATESRANCDRELNALTLGYLRLSPLLFSLSSRRRATEAQPNVLPDGDRQKDEATVRLEANVDGQEDSEVDRDNYWPAFDVLGQQVATLADIQMRKQYNKQPGQQQLIKEKVFQVDTLFSTRPTTFGLPSTTPGGALQTNNNLLTRSIFWSNFIPALNCTRTQPIIPAHNSLLLLAGGSSTHHHQQNLQLHLSSATLNSSSLGLLSLNLQSLSCSSSTSSLHTQHQLPKTGLDFIQSLGSTIHRQLQSAIAQYRASVELTAASSASYSAHSSHINQHKLRMANETASSGVNTSSSSSSSSQLLELDTSRGNESSSSSYSEHGNGGGLEEATYATVAPSSGGNIMKRFLKRITDQFQQYTTTTSTRGGAGLLLMIAVSAILVTLSLAAGAWALVKQHSKQNEAKPDHTNHRLEQQQQPPIDGAEVTNNKNNNNNHNDNYQPQQSVLVMQHSSSPAAQIDGGLELSDYYVDNLEGEQMSSAACVRLNGLELPSVGGGGVGGRDGSETILSSCADADESAIILSHHHHHHHHTQNHPLDLDMSHMNYEAGEQESNDAAVAATLPPHLCNMSEQLEQINGSSSTSDQAATAQLLVDHTDNQRHSSRSTQQANSAAAAVYYWPAMQEGATITTNKHDSLTIVDCDDNDPSSTTTTTTTTTQMNNAQMRSLCRSHSTAFNNQSNLEQQQLHLYNQRSAHSHMQPIMIPLVTNSSFHSSQQSISLRDGSSNGATATIGNSYNHHQHQQQQQQKQNQFNAARSYSSLNSSTSHSNNNNNNTITNTTKKKRVKISDPATNSNSSSTLIDDQQRATARVHHMSDFENSFICPVHRNNLSNGLLNNNNYNNNDSAHLLAPSSSLLNTTSEQHDQYPVLYNLSQDITQQQQQLEDVSDLIRALPQETQFFTGNRKRTTTTSRKRNENHSNLHDNMIARTTQNNDFSNTYHERQLHHQHQQDQQQTIVDNSYFIPQQMYLQQQYQQIQDNHHHQSHNKKHT